MACRRRAGRSGDGRRLAPLGAPAARLEARDLRQQALRLGVGRLCRGRRRGAGRTVARCRRAATRVVRHRRRGGLEGGPSVRREIDVFVEPFTGAPAVERGTSYVVVAGEGLGERWQGDADGRTGLREEDGRTVFAERVSPPPRLVIVGAGDIAEAICALARPLGWHTQVVEPRTGLATRERVPSADEIDRGLARRDRGRCEHRRRLARPRGAARPPGAAGRRRGRRVLRRRARLAADAGEAPRCSSATRSPTAFAARWGSSSAARRRPRSRSRSSPRSSRSRSPCPYRRLT